MVYQYTAYTNDKKIVQGRIEAISAGMAETALYQAGYHRILRLREVHTILGLEKLMPTFFGVKAQDVVDFSRQLANLTESGVAVLTALKLLEGQAARVALKKVIAGLVEELRGGRSLSQAMGRYPQAFSYTYCQMVKASEQAGSLEAGLRQVASHMEKQMEAAKKIGRALAYPGLVLLMSIGVFVFMVTVALPPLVKLFTSLGARLPWTTSLVISTATFLIDYRLYLLVGLAGLVVAAAIYLRLPAGKLAMDRLMLRLPVLGSITLEHYLYRWCQSTAMMLKAGLPLPQIMDIVLPTVRNRIVHQALVEVGEGVIGGRALSQSMAATGLFPSLLVEMLAVGEKTGNLDATIETLANFYEQKVDRRVDALTAMIEPVLTIAIGLVVAFIALSMITPLYSVLQSFR